MACIQAYFVARDSLGSRFDAVGVGAMNLAWTIEQVPETIIGSAMAVALLPSLATFIDNRDFSTFTQTVNRALRVMLALCLPAAALIGITVRPLAATFFGFEPARLELLTVCTWAFLLGLVGDTWLEVAVRCHYANLDTRTPLVAAFLQVSAFILLCLVLPRWIGLAGIPLAAAITFTIQALALLLLMNRRYPGLMDVGSTAMRGVAAAVAAGAVGLAVLNYLPLGRATAAIAALVAGAAVAIPLVRRELRVLMRL
jgi:putative peptidoglycan lipid II flippase